MTRFLPWVRKGTSSDFVRFLAFTLGEFDKSVMGVLFNGITGFMDMPGLQGNQ